MEFIHKELSSKVIEAYYNVYNTLGYGFLKHKAQLVNYLKATKIEVGLLFNFGPKPELSRKIFSNQDKH